jgi:hypothetical protein
MPPRPDNRGCPRPRSDDPGRHFRRERRPTAIGGRGNYGADSDSACRGRAGEYEIISDGLSRQIPAGLAGGVAALDPDLPQKAA